MIPLPDPPLRSGTILLRPWLVEDAPALVEAWSDPEIQRWTAVPEVRDLDHAEGWIAGWEQRREAGLSLDLVIQRDQRVVGEVGLFDWHRRRGTIQIGWWTAPGHRRQGIATAAARLLVEWAPMPLGVAVLAHCDPANPGSIAVAEAAGAVVIIDDGIP